MTELPNRLAFRDIESATDSFNLEIALKFGIFSAVRKGVISLIVCLFAVSGAFAARNSQKLPDGLQYRQIKKIILKDTRSTFKSAEKYFNKGKNSLSDQYYLSAIEKGEKFYGIWGRAWVARQSKDYLAAGKLYTEAFLLNDSLEIFLHDYALYLQQYSQDWDWINKICTRLYDVTKEEEALSILLEAADRLNQRPAALKSLQELARRYPIRADVQVFYSSLLYESGSKEMAIEVARQAISITQDPFHLKLLVLLLTQEGYFIESAQACEKLSKIAPRSAHTLEAWGFLEFQQGHYQNAVTHYRKALNRDYRLSTLMSLARLNVFYLNEADQAIYYVKAILNLDRDNCDALYIMAEVKRRQGNIKAALKYSERLMDLQPEHPQTYYYHGKLYMQNKDFHNAVKYLETAVLYNPDIKRYRLVLAKAYAGAGLTDKARETYTNYLNEPLKDLWQEENMLKGTPPSPR